MTRQHEEHINPYQSPRCDVSTCEASKRSILLHRCIAVVVGTFGVLDIYGGLFDLLMLLVSVWMRVNPGLPHKDASAGLLLFEAMGFLITGLLELWATRAWWKCRTVPAIVLTALAWLSSLVVGRFVG